MSDAINTVENQHVEEHHEIDLRDDYGSKMGMWLFLFTELLLFGGLFILYMAYRFEYSDLFKLSAKELKVSLGAVNTIILLTSSLTMVLSIVAIQRGNKKLSITFLTSTIVFAFGFLVVKYFEWSEKFHHGLFPGKEHLLELPQGQKIFFSLYYAMTGLHGIHIVVGILLLTWMLILVIRDRIRADKYMNLENAGLYWHLVDLIWIFLFPLFYLLH